MGCDIHLYIEYKHTEDNLWSNFGKRINPGRNYGVFADLAGVRNSYGVTPATVPRGYPEDAAFATADDYWLNVTEVEGEGCCSPKQAEVYVSYGSRYSDETKNFVSNPDWHSHSWLTPDEYAKAIDGHAEPEYRAILAALRSFEADGYQARVVFWFDN